MSTFLRLASGVFACSVFLPISLFAQQLSSIKICSGGDVALGTNLPHGNTSFLQHSPDKLLRPLKPVVQDADILLFNLETTIGEGPSWSKCGPESTNCFAFRSPPSSASALKNFAGEIPFVLNVANNHSMDAGGKGFRNTLKALKSEELLVTGVDSSATFVTTKDGVRVAFLGFSTSTGPSVHDITSVKRFVKQARKRADLVVVTMHIGAEGKAAQRTRDKEEIFLKTIRRGNPVAFSRAAVDAGADLVIGHGPHVMRAMELYEDKLIAYSLGNLLTYGPFSFAPPLNRGGILCTRLDVKGRLLEAKLHSTKQRKPGIVSLDAENRAAFLTDSLGVLDFPSSGVRFKKDGTLKIPPTPLGEPISNRSPRK